MSPDGAAGSLLGSAAARAESLADFRKPVDAADATHPRALLMSLKNREGALLPAARGLLTAAGAAGLTLTVADTVYLLEPCLNFGLEDQGIARIHRIGQAHPTTVVRLVVKDTIEEKLLAIQQRKRSNVGLTQAQTTSEILSLVGIDETPDWFKVRCCRRRRARQRRRRPSRRCIRLRRPHRSMPATRTTTWTADVRLRSPPKL